MGHITLQETEHITFKTYSGSSQDLATSVASKNGPGGWLVGWYFGASEAATLNQATPSMNFGDPLVMYGAHLVLVAGGPPTTDGDPVTVQVTGTSLSGDGFRTANDSEVVTLEGVTLNTMRQTEKRWLGQVTITLLSGAANYSFQFNYGFALSEEFGGHHFKMDQVMIQGTATEDDDQFDLIFYRHCGECDWEFAATDWDMHGPVIAELSYLVGPEVHLKKNQPFGGFKKEINQYFRGHEHEGLVVRMKTGSSKSVGNITLHLGAVI